MTPGVMPGFMASRRGREVGKAGKARRGEERNERHRCPFKVSYDKIRHDNPTTIWNGTPAVPLFKPRGYEVEVFNEWLTLRGLV